MKLTAVYYTMRKFSNQSRILLSFLPVIVLCIIFSEPANATNSIVDINHPVYEYLQRLEAKGFIRDLRLYSRPNTREEIGELLVLTYRASEAGENLTRYDRQRLLKYLQEFDAYRLFEGYEAKQGENHLVRYSHQNWRFTGDVMADLSNRLQSNNAPYPVIGFGGEMRGSYYPSGESNSSITGYLRWLTFVEFTEDTTYGEFGAEEGRAYTVRDGVLNSNRIRTGIFWESNLGRISYLHDTPKWGRGRIAGLQIGGAAPEFDLLHYAGWFGKLRFTFLMGKLNSNYGQRFLGGHRLEWQPVRWLQFSVGETVIYGDSTNARGIEYTYLNPFIPYTAAEMNVGDRDNNTGAIGFTAFLRDKVTIYGEALFDDFVFNKSFTEYFANKWAGLLGFYWIDPIDIPGSSVTFEYVRIEPWVYTHVDRVNIYRHFGTSLGYPLKPNSDRTLLALDKGFGRRWNITGTVMHSRHGAGDFEQSHDHPASVPYVPEKSFLQGALTRETKTSLGIRYEFMQSSYVRGTYIYTSRTGESAFQQAIIGLSLNY
ncbi:MAG: capsule assembly Wzi family protein [Candidatus Marinimicrobia bacterium]|nr:capsule assembly Wzi family protein [Candidatus Neomarinimicrobiota bacterium]MCF7830132.1 capsule assembly Wzi family protein [Candidatus Neomarinimicrobiota bacterium]MCF7882209.1 capsule assembly Wzi family protein [Candidatus Neomarinimicrobiota bacterium]